MNVASYSSLPKVLHFNDKDKAAIARAQGQFEEHQRLLGMIDGLATKRVEIMKAPTAERKELEFKFIESFRAITNNWDFPQFAEYNNRFSGAVARLFKK